jgi:hypothetical protein
MIVLGIEGSANKLGVGIVTDDFKVSRFICLYTLRVYLSVCSSAFCLSVCLSSCQSVYIVTDDFKALRLIIKQIVLPVNTRLSSSKIA